MKFLVSGNSMKPAFPAGSRVLVSKIALRLRKLRVGDAIVLKDPRDGRLILKRILSKDGDKYLVAGDNPNESTDSRQFGPVSIKEVIGRVVFQNLEYRKLQLAFSMLLLTLVGIGDSFYLAYQHYQGDSAVCVVGSGACNIVTTSQYAIVAGIPLALLGMLFYSSMLALILFYILKRWDKAPKVILGWAAIGFLTSLYLTYLQAFVIDAFCPLCLLSALSSTLIFLGSLALTRWGNAGKMAGV